MIGSPVSRIVGVGGIFTAHDVRDRLSAGADHMQLAPRRCWI